MADVAQTIELLPSVNLNGSTDALRAAGYDSYRSDQLATLLPLLAWGDGDVTIDAVKAGVQKARARHLDFVGKLLEQAGSTVSAADYLDAVQKDPSKAPTVSPTFDVLSLTLGSIWSNLGVVLTQDGKPFILPFH
jgi:hypothetical protein